MSQTPTLIGLPKDIRNATRADLERLGFVFLKPINRLFVQCQLPSGWTTLLHPNSKLIHHLRDERGRLRAKIMLVYNWLDLVKRAHLVLSHRYQYTIAQPVPNGLRIEITSAGLPLWQSETIIAANVDNARIIMEGLHQRAVNWLTERYPLWASPLAYWED